MQLNAHSTPLGAGAQEYQGLIKSITFQVSMDNLSGWRITMKDGKTFKGYFSEALGLLDFLIENKEAPLKYISGEILLRLPSPEYVPLPDRSYNRSHLLTARIVAINIERRSKNELHVFVMVEKDQKIYWLLLNAVDTVEVARYLIAIENSMEMRHIYLSAPWSSARALAGDLRILGIEELWPKRLLSHEQYKKHSSTESQSGRIGKLEYINGSIGVQLERHGYPYLLKRKLNKDSTMLQCLMTAQNRGARISLWLKSMGPTKPAQVEGISQAPDELTQGEKMVVMFQKINGLKVVPPGIRFIIREI